MKAKEYPNGLDVTVVRTEVRPPYTPPGKPTPSVPDIYWVVTAKGVEGEAYVKENKPMSDKLEDLNIEDPTGKSFILTQTTIQGNKTWSIARAI